MAAKRWLDEDFFWENPLKINFNFLLMDVEQDWFVEFIITALYPRIHKIETLSNILKDWNDLRHNYHEKISAVFYVCFEDPCCWQLKCAFNYMLPLGAEYLGYAIPLTPKELLEKQKALGNAVFARGISNREKERLFLTKQVEIRAIGNRNYRFILYALYVYRKKFRIYSDPWLNPTFMDDYTREYFAFILNTGLDDIDIINSNDGIFESKTKALQMFIKYFKIYDTKVFEQHPALHDSVDVHLEQSKVLIVRGGILTPFQILLSNICRGLSDDCVEALFEFKLFLLDFSCFVRTINNIGKEEGYILS